MEYTAVHYPSDMAVRGLNLKPFQVHRKVIHGNCCTSLCFYLDVRIQEDVVLR